MHIVRVNAGIVGGYKPTVVEVYTPAAWKELLSIGFTGALVRDRDAGHAQCQGYPAHQVLHGMALQQFL